MKQIKRAMRLVLLLGCLFLISFGASAETIGEKTITVVNAGSRVRLEMTPENEPAFWEYPLLPAGQTRPAGTLRLKNDSDQAVTFRLSAVKLPYGNEEALEYLDSLLITVKDGDTLLYEGTYSHIADEGKGLKIELADWQPGSEKLLSISLHCKFTYEGDPVKASKPVTWEYMAFLAGGEGEGGESSQITPPGPIEQPKGTMVIICVAGGLVLLCALLGSVGVFVKTKKKKDR